MFIFYHGCKGVKMVFYMPDKAILYSFYKKKENIRKIKINREKEIYKDKNKQYTSIMEVAIFTYFN